MKNRPFLTFMLVIGAMVASIVAFIQSRAFAEVAKRTMAKYLPKDLGIDADFDDLAVKIFPPGLSIRGVKLRVGQGRISTDLPAGSTVNAGRIDLIFRPFQLFSGSILVNRVVVVDGEIAATFDKAFLASRKRAQAKRRNPLPLGWDQLLRVHAEGVGLENTKVKLRWSDPDFETEVLARSLEFGQWSGKGGLGYLLALDVASATGRFPKEWRLPESLGSLRVRARGNALGLEIQELALSREGVEIAARGRVQGNLLDPKGLLFDGEAKLQSELATLLALVPELSRSFGATAPDGLVRFQGNVTGNLVDAFNTLRADGTLSGERLRYRGWQADELEVRGSWAAGPGGGEVTLAKLSIASKERKRVGGFQPGHGGRVEAGPAKLKLGSDEPVQIPVRFERAHIHWLAAPGLKDVYPLDFRLSGATQLLLTPARAKQPWGAVAQLKLDVLDFGVDNQRLNQKKPMRNVLHVPKVGVLGDVRIDASGIRPEGVVLLLPHSKFTVGGEVDFKKGLNLRAGGPTDLADVDQIAENELRGVGTIMAHIHGPPRNVIVDFDTELQDAHYLKLAFGDLKGRITYDDDANLLKFVGVEAAKGRSRYRADGVIDIGKVEKADLTAEITQGYVKDFSVIFGELVKGIPWYPASLTGELTGRVRVTGGLGLDQISILADVSGSNWEYLGERFKHVKARGGYERGRYLLEGLKAQKGAGALDGRISFDGPTKKYDWELRSSNLSMTDLDQVARLDVPIRGRLSLVSTGTGKEGAVESSTQLQLGDFRVRGSALPASDVALRTHGGAAQVRAYLMGGQGLIDGTYDFRPGGDSTLRAELRSLDFSPVLLLLNSKSIQDRNLAGVISGLADLTFKSGRIEVASGRLALTEYVLAKSGTRFELAKPVAFTVDRGTFELSDLRIHGREGEARLELRGRGGELEGKISGEIDTSLVEFFTPSVAQATGTADLDFTVGGALKEPSIFGRAALSGASLKVASLESPFENITGSLQLRQNVVTVHGIEGDLAGGRVGATGKVELFADRFPKLDLHATLIDNRVKIYPFQFVKVRGKISVAGDDVPYAIGGELVADSGLIKEKMMARAQGAQLKTASYTPPPTSRREGDYPKFKLEIHVAAERGILVQNDLFDCEVKGDVTIVNTLEAPRPVGSAEVIQGKMLFQDRSFAIQSANIEFDNPTAINPRFNMTASTDLNQVKIQLFVSGRLDKYKVELSSNPAMPEQTLLQMLATGLSADDFKKLRAADRGAIQQGEAAALVLQSLDFNRDMKDKLGLQVNLDEAVNTQQANSVTRPRTDLDATASPKIVIKRQIGKKVDLSVGSTVGVGTNSQKQINAEYHVTPGISVIGVWDSLQGVEAQGRTSYGIDFKVQQRFK